MAAEVRPETRLYDYLNELFNRPERDGQGNVMHVPMERIEGDLWQVRRRMLGNRALLEAGGPPLALSEPLTEVRLYRSAAGEVRADFHAVLDERVDDVPYSQFLYTANGGVSLSGEWPRMVLPSHYRAMEFMLREASVSVPDVEILPSRF